MRSVKAKILVVQKDEPATDALKEYLQATGSSVSLVVLGEDAVLTLREEVPDVLLIDWDLPDVPGPAICQRLRSNSTTMSLPIIMLTARADEADRIRGLNAGADDYVVKPFSIAELVARINALLRRANPACRSTRFVVGDIELDREAHSVKRGGRSIELRPREFRLLEYFMANPGRVLTRTQILDAAWGRDVFVDERTVDVHVGRLRRRLSLSGDIDPIRAVRGVGYLLA